jgi:ATP adenylyltransferase
MDLQFLVSVLNAANNDKKPGSSAPTVTDVFAQLPPQLRVGDLLDTHTILLNKFPVIPMHAVIVSKTFLPQTDGISPVDMEALWTM